MDSKFNFDEWIEYNRYCDDYQRGPGLWADAVDNQRFKELAENFGAVDQRSLITEYILDLHKKLKEKRGQDEVMEATIQPGAFQIFARSVSEIFRRRCKKKLENNRAGADSFELPREFTRKLPPYEHSLFISHNEHRTFHRSVEEEIKDYELGDFLSAEDRQRCIDEDSLWEVRWYPNTSLGFCFVVGSTLENCLEKINAERK